MPIVTSLDDLKTVTDRIDAGLSSLGITSSPQVVENFVVGIEMGYRIVVLGTGSSGVVAANYDAPAGVWWVSHVFGLTQTAWRAMLKELNDEFIRRGYGDTPVRWTDAGPVAAAMSRRFKITVLDGYYEFTPNQAAGLL